MLSESHSADRIQVRTLDLEDLNSVALIHQAAFPHGAITRLGHEAVRRYYEWQLTGPHDCVALGALVDGRLRGFCFGGTFRGALSGYLRRNRIFLAQRLLLRPWLLNDPLFRGRFSRAIAVLRSGRKRSPIAAPPAEVTSFAILSIGVHPEDQGSGVGQSLMQAADARARRKGCMQMHLSVHGENLQAIRFYERSGWVKINEEGQWTGRMIRRLID